MLMPAQDRSHVVGVMKKLLLFLCIPAIMYGAAEKISYPLHKAVKNNNVSLVKELIDGGANVNARDDKERTPLMRIEYSYDEESPYDPLFIAKLLVTHGADVNARDADGETALYHLASKSRWLLGQNREEGINQVIDYLIEHGADVNTTNHLNRTPLFAAAFNRKVSAVRTLLKNPEIKLDIKGSWRPNQFLLPLGLAEEAVVEMRLFNQTKYVVYEYIKIADLLKQAQQVQPALRLQAHAQAQTQARIEAKAIAGALLPQAGGGSPARLLAPADIQLIEQNLEPALYREIYKQLIAPYLE